MLDSYMKNEETSQKHWFQLLEKYYTWKRRDKNVKSEEIRTAVASWNYNYHYNSVVAGMSNKSSTNVRPS